MNNEDEITQEDLDRLLAKRIGITYEELQAAAWHEEKYSHPERSGYIIVFDPETPQDIMIKITKRWKSNRITFIIEDTADD